jgi:hypothetical protein
MSRLLPLFWIAVVLIGCDSRVTMNTHLYNIDSLVSEQSRLLAAGNAKLHKEAIVIDGNDTLEYTPKDSLAWNRELDVFRQLDAMNKPVNRSNYLVDDNLYDPGSNLTVKAFTALDELPVRSLRVFYDTDIRTPRKIEAVYDEQNALYHSTRNLLLEFQQVNNKNLLTSYSIDGGQKMILSDSVTFTVRGKIHF